MAGNKLVVVLSTRTLAPAPSGAHAYIDGGITIQEFLRAGLIQRLIATRQYALGLVQSEYQVGT